MEPSTKKQRDFKAMLVERMHDPLQLRAALCVGLLAAWYSMGFTPMRDRIASTTYQLERDHKRLALATEVESLRAEAAQFADRLPPRSDPNEFLQYVLGGIRAGSLKLISLQPDKPTDAGPFQVATVKVELEGKYQDVAAFLRWIEDNKRLLRVDNLKLDPDSKDPSTLKVGMSVLGLMGAEAEPKAPAKAEPKAPASKTAKSGAKSKAVALEGKPATARTAK